MLENTKDKLAVDAERDPMAPNRHTIRLPKRPYAALTWPAGDTCLAPYMTTLHAWLYLFLTRCPHWRLRFYLATPDNKCPHVDNLDAGACVGLGNRTCWRDTLSFTHYDSPHITVPAARPSALSHTDHAQADHSKFGCLPSFLIIGTMKGGTAELQGWLSNHPNLHRW